MTGRGGGAGRGPAGGLTFRGVPLDVGWVKGEGQAPPRAGLYAQIYWPERAVRIGQSSDIRGRLRQAAAWARAMQAGTAAPAQLRRTGALCERVKATGTDGFEGFAISVHPLLRDRATRLECEAFLFGWLAAVAARDGWRDWNGERVRGPLRAVFDAARRDHGRPRPQV